MVFLSMEFFSDHFLSALGLTLKFRWGRIVIWHQKLDRFAVAQRKQGNFILPCTNFWKIKCCWPRRHSTRRVKILLLFLNTKRKKKIIIIFATTIFEWYGKEYLRGRYLDLAYALGKWSGLRVSISYCWQDYPCEYKSYGIVFVSSLMYRLRNKKKMRKSFCNQTSWLFTVSYDFKNLVECT